MTVYLVIEHIIQPESLPLCVGRPGETDQVVLSGRRRVGGASAGHLRDSLQGFTVGSRAVHRRRATSRIASAGDVPRDRVAFECLTRARPLEP